MNGVNYNTPYPYLYDEFMEHTKNNKKQINSIYGKHPIGWEIINIIKGEGDIMNDKVRVITICGSMRFADEMKKQESKLTKDGYIVLIPLMDVEETATEADLLVYRNAHIQKIKMSDAIYVVNVDGYVGHHTSSEIEEASRMNKRIYFLEKADK